MRWTQGIRVGGGEKSRVLDGREDVKIGEGREGEGADDGLDGIERCMLGDGP